MENNPPLMRCDTANRGVSKMASKVLAADDLEKLIGEVEQMDPDKVRHLAQEYARKEALAKEKRKEYHQKKSPEQIAKQREYMKKRSALERERMKAVFAKAKELGIEV